ncbi:MAG: hypothetical protein ACYDBM_11415 [Candidatus Tyrphobacter sp.]
MVKTYPTPAQKGIEVSCTAAISDKSEWIRLFPVPWRYLESDKRFRKYQWVEVSVAKATADVRPESYKLNTDGIRIVSDPLPTTKAWHERKNVVKPLMAHCLCCLMEKRDRDGHPTLGLFRPKSIKKLRITPVSPDWTAQQSVLINQGDLFKKSPKRVLQKIPYGFYYHFNCDHDSCAGHQLSCTDWELGESYRKWRREYENQWEEKFRQKYEADMIGKYDTHFFVGTVHQHPRNWIICGLFYPPRVVENLTLF